MSKYSLIEYKLRQYIYLGYKYSVYVPPSLRYNVSKNMNHHNDVIGVQIIAKIVNKNVSKDINSIVPIIKKIKKEDKLHDDKQLIFALAVCAKLNLKQCEKMVADAYAAVPLICTDGLKLLMFVKFYHIAAKILNDLGYLDKISRYGSGFHKAMKKWYLNRDPIETTKQITRHKSYDGYTHKQVMYIIHLHSDNPSHQMFIVYTFYGIDKVKKLYLSDWSKNYKNNLKRKELTIIYNYLIKLNSLIVMDKNKLQQELQLNMWGKEYEVVPQKRFESTKVLSALAMHIPLRSLLNNTYCFSKYGLFHNDGLCNKFFLRFNESLVLKMAQIHPIESFVEYFKYSKTSKSIDSIFINIIKKKEEPPQYLNFNSEEWVIPKESLAELPSTEINIGEIEFQPIVSNEVSDEIKCIYLYPRRHSKPLLKFLCEDLPHKLLENLKPTGQRILISYESRLGLDTKYVKFMQHNIITVLDAITLISLSIIYPEHKINNNPHICKILEHEKPFKLFQINKLKTLNYRGLYQQLFSETIDDGTNCNILKEDIPELYPEFSINWARSNKKMYDVFVFLGTNHMSLKNIKKAKKDYDEKFKSKVKIIVCCLNGLHVNAADLSREGILIICGFDKNVGKIITSFMNGEF